MNEQTNTDSDETMADALHRGVKLLLDTENITKEEAEHILRGYSLRCVVGAEIANSPTLQAALLTIVNTAHRCCLGGVFVEGLPDGAPLLLPLFGPGGMDLATATAVWGGTMVDVDASGDMPTVILGNPTKHIAKMSGPVLHLGFNGWISEVRPYSGPAERAPIGREFILSGVLAGAMAVSEAFQFLRGAVPSAMRRQIRRSLWVVSGNADMLDAAGPETYVLPKSIWMLGLGHLGQAFLWCHLLLPYEKSSEVRVVLNDYDRITTANLSTSLLSLAGDVGKKKSRHLAAVLETRGFAAVIQERPYDANFTCTSDDPQLLLCGVDTYTVRQIIGKAAFPEIIEAGIGDTAESYLDFQMHTFPGKRSPEEIWSHNKIRPVALNRHQRHGYQDMVSHGVDRCGIVEIAGKAVGVPFVGAYVAALVIAEAIKAVMGGPRIEVADGSLSSPERTKSHHRTSNLPAINLGYLHPKQ